MTNRKTEGARLLGKVSATQIEIAASIGVSQGCVAQWAAGPKKPSETNRARLFSCYGIAPDAWDRAAGVPRAEAPATVQPDDEPVPRRVDALGGIQQEIARYDRALADPELSDLRKVAFAKARVSALRTYAQLEGTAGEISESRVIRMPAFRRVLAVLRAALEPWPDALASVGKELERLGGER